MTFFNSWITRSVRNLLLWALQYANISLRRRHFRNQSVRTKTPDIKTTIEEVLNVHCACSQLSMI